MLRIESWVAGFRPYALLGALCVLLYLPGVAAIPPLDRDEARFAQATRQMLETGDFVRIRFQDEARNKKPAGIYWLQAASVSLFSEPTSTAIWPYRLPSLIGAMAAVLLTFTFACRLLPPMPDEPGRRLAALAGAVLLGSSLLLVGEAHIAKTDAVLLAAIVAGQGALGLAYVRSRRRKPVGWRIALVFWLAETAAILLKGPPGPVLAILTAGTLAIADRDARWLRGLRPLPGLALMAVLVAPWVIAIEHASDGRFLSESLGRDLLAKLAGAQESHGGPPLYYLLLSVLTFWPGSLFLAPALVEGWRQVERPAQRFLLAWIAPAWIGLELVPTKLPHYILPLYPGLALLVGMTLVQARTWAKASWAARVDAAVRCLWALAAMLLAAVLLVMPARFGAGVSPIGCIAALALLGITAAMLYRRPTHPKVALGAAGLSFVLAGTLLGVIAPGLDRLWLSRAAADLVAENPRAGPPLVSVGYSEPSLVFLLGTGLRLTTPGGAGQLLARGGSALVSGREEAMFRQAVVTRGLIASALGNVRGTDYSNGQRMVITLYKVEAE